MILTSGTTGTPKGASRGNPETLDPVVSYLSKIPLKARDTIHIAAPLFHSWGFAHFSLGLILGMTYVLRRKFDPEACLAEVARTRADALAVVPVMMQRILDLPEETRGKYDTSSLKVVAASGSRCPATSPLAGWTGSATPSTTSTARPRWRGPRSPRRPTCAPRPAPRAARRAARS